MSASLILALVSSIPNGFSKIFPPSNGFNLYTARVSLFWKHEKNKNRENVKMAFKR